MIRILLLKMLPVSPEPGATIPYFDDVVLMTSSNEGLFILDANREE
ncbi:hypothetical protein [Rhodohalobacter sp.]|nr:hypothetical protein [Rhodohalobacter sp.]MDZ7756196.1 hypothetical protein [Rhodohalobacter sp.]